MSKRSPILKRFNTGFAILFAKPLMAVKWSLTVLVNTVIEVGYWFWGLFSFRVDSEIELVAKIILWLFLYQIFMKGLAG